MIIYIYNTHHKHNLEVKKQNKHRWGTPELAARSHQSNQSWLSFSSGNHGKIMGKPWENIWLMDA